MISEDWREPGDLLYIPPHVGRYPIFSEKKDQSYINGDSARWSPKTGWWRNAYEVN